MDIQLENGASFRNVGIDELGRLVELGLLPTFPSVEVKPNVELSKANPIDASCFKEVDIGNQVWMAENLNVDDGGEGIYKNPKNNEYYYTWDAAMRVAKSIPGWHLPTSLEWNKAALACGATEKPYNDNPNYNNYEDAQDLKDRLGVKLAGYYYGSFSNVGSDAFFWTSTEFSSSNAYYRYFSTGTSMDSSGNDKNYGSSVRLVKDSA